MTLHPPRNQSLQDPRGGPIFNSHLWHGGTQNRSDRPRRALHAYFTRRSNQQQLDQKKYIRPQTLARLSPAARFILDV
jgi:ectoine hydroxylase-related dioxygenase (phytanoyl-CoA dioxygenase family)